MIRAAYFTYLRNPEGGIALPQHLLELKELFKSHDQSIGHWEARRPPARHVLNVLKPDLKAAGYLSTETLADTSAALQGLGDAELSISFSQLNTEARTALHLMGRSAWERREFLHQLLTAGLHPEIDYLVLTALNQHGRSQQPHFTWVCNYLKVLYRDPQRFRLPLSGVLVIGYGPDDAPRPAAENEEQPQADKADTDKTK